MVTVSSPPPAMAPGAPFGHNKSFGGDAALAAAEKTNAATKACSFTVSPRISGSAEHYQKAEGGEAQADFFAASPMMAWISGMQEPQLVPHLRRLPISTVVAAPPSSRAQAAIGLRPTPKHEHTSAP